MANQTVGVSTREESTVTEVKSLVGAAWTRGSGPEKKIRNPATGEVVSSVSFSTTEQIDGAVAAAKHAQREWTKIPVATRASILLRSVDAIEANSEQIAVQTSAEVGKTYAEAREEMEVTCLVARNLIADARKMGGVTLPSAASEYPNRRVQTTYSPIGVTAFISPWNFPVEMIVNCVASMMMGNACVWKPSEWAPTGPAIATRDLMETGIPPGLLNVVWGGPEEGEHLVAHRHVGLLSFIGSTAVGEQITRSAGVKRLLLELGGNGPLIVLEDADLDRAVETAITDCFYQAGQVCTAGERILVHESIHDEFAERVAAAAKGLKVGDPLDESTDMGPLSDQRILDKVSEHVEDARASGAEILTGGEANGLFYQPTVLVGVTPSMRIAREETFGPVAPIIKVGSAEEALEIANDSPYGLSMGVFTSSLRTAYLMAEGLEAGSVNVNSGTNSWEFFGPFGGFKKSGIGRELWVSEFANHKTVTFDVG